MGNIRGADAATYLNEVSAGWGEGGDEEPPRCTCGFSAVVNRRRAHRAGLFYEVRIFSKKIFFLLTKPHGIKETNRIQTTFEAKTVD